MVGHKDCAGSIAPWRHWIGPGRRTQNSGTTMTPEARIPAPLPALHAVFAMPLQGHPRKSGIHPHRAGIAVRCRPPGDRELLRGNRGSSPPWNREALHFPVRTFPPRNQSDYAQYREQRARYYPVASTASLSRHRAFLLRLFHEDLFDGNFLHGGDGIEGVEVHAFAVAHDGD
jgi:hypothetical protein